MINILVNTTTAYPAIYTEYDGDYKSYISDGYNSHSQNLIILIQDFLQSNKIKLTDVDNVFIITGPGSYTGIRVGISLVLGFQIALKISVIPLTLFQAYYLKYRSDDFNQLLILIDSKKNGEYYYRNLLPGKHIDDVGVLSLHDLPQLISDDCLISGEFDQGVFAKNLCGKSVKYDNSNFDIKLLFQNQFFLKKLSPKLEAFYLKKLFLV